MAEVSIIVPVYNSEKFLDAAVQSVLAQTYGDWELILVDDCSTDGSLSLANQYATSDNRIKALKNENNSGPARTRNVGIEAAIGKYLSFLDSDDTLKPNFLERMVETAEKYDADIVWCNYDEVHLNGKIIPVRNNMEKGRILNGRNALEGIFHNEPGIGSLCNKLLLKSLLHNHSLRINEKRVRAEDWEFNINAFQKVERLVCIEDSLYNYLRQNSSSVMSSYRPKDFALMCESVRLLKNLAEKYSITPPNGFYGAGVNNFIEHAFKAVAHDKENRLCILKKMSQSEEVRFSVSDMKRGSLSRAYSVMLWLMMRSPRAAVLWARIVQKI